MPRLLIISVLVILIFSCSNSQNHRHTASKIVNYLENKFTSCPTGGVVLVSINDSIIVKNAYGTANLDLKTPMQINNSFGIGSITKPITSAAIISLVDQGKISLTDNIQKYVPEINTHGRVITIAQVLSHTSGLPNFVDLQNFDSISKSKLTPIEILSLTNQIPLKFDPGSDHFYSDAGYILLGLIIERVSGMSYADYLQSEFFKAIGMQSTTYGMNNNNVAQGYSFHKGIKTAEFIDMSIPYSAGAIFSTVDDLYLWVTSIGDGKLISDSLLRKSWKPTLLANGDSIDYGYGWELSEIEGQKTVSHGGFINGYGSSLLHIPEKGITVIVLINNDADRPEPGAMAREIASMLIKLQVGAVTNSSFKLKDRVESLTATCFELAAAEILAFVGLRDQYISSLSAGR